MEIFVLGYFTIPPTPADDSSNRQHFVRDPSLLGSLIMMFARGLSVILIQPVFTSATTAYALSSSPPTGMNIFAASMSDQHKSRSFVDDSEDMEPIFQMDEDHVTESTTLRPNIPGDWYDFRYLTRESLACIQMRMNGGDCFDNDGDSDGRGSRISFSSDPDSIQGQGNRGLSPSLTTTIQSWDFELDDLRLPEAGNPVSADPVGRLSKLDLDRFRQLTAPALRGKVVVKGETLARSLPTEASSGHLIKAGNDAGDFRPSLLSRLDFNAVKHASNRPASLFRGYSSDGGDS